MDHSKPIPQELVRIAQDQACFVQDQQPLDSTICSNIKKGILSGLGELNGRVAVKYLRKSMLITSTEVAEQFQKEVGIWSSVSHHPTILSFSGITQCPSTRDMGMVSPLMTNGTILPFLDRHPTTEKAVLLCDVTDALSYLHSLPSPILHGDIKSWNILINDHGRAVLCDFGASKILVPGSPLLSGSHPGSLRWMAPEVIKPGQIISLKADVYSFGCLCIEVFTNKRPFDEIINDGAVILEVAVKRRQPQRPRSLSDDLLWATIETCFAYDPSDRPSVAEVCSILGSLST
ncbi:kinase-like domain-containing protein [Mycena floridula]|nr:kinase-like domain-containing protein [Mycena floridula]KAJ7576230.1 kinase-like domain-containing protein [Mycena floridula]